jgi:hypothetical protein
MSSVRGGCCRSGAEHEGPTEDSRRSVVPGPVIPHRTDILVAGSGQSVAAAGVALCVVVGEFAEERVAEAETERKGVAWVGGSLCLGQRGTLSAVRPPTMLREDYRGRPLCPPPLATTPSSYAIGWAGLSLF